MYAFLMAASWNNRPKGGMGGTVSIFKVGLSMYMLVFRYIMAIVVITNTSEGLDCGGEPKGK